MDEVERIIENVRNERRWLEKSLTIVAFHKLQQSKYDNVRGSKWKISDTADSLHLSIGYISESILLVKMSSKLNLEGLTRDKALETIKDYKNMDSI